MSNQSKGMQLKNFYLIDTKAVFCLGLTFFNQENYKYCFKLFNGRNKNDWWALLPEMCFPSPLLRSHQPVIHFVWAKNGPRTDQDITFSLRNPLQLQKNSKNETKTTHEWRINPSFYVKNSKPIITTIQKHQLKLAYWFDIKYFY